MLAHHVLSIAAQAAPGRDQVVKIMPVGTWRGRDGRGPYRVDDANALIEATRRHAGAVKMPIDLDHALALAAPQGRPAPAFGWIKGLQARGGGIFALVEWTVQGAELIRSGAYRYLSPVFSHKNDGTITLIHHASLVNDPNFQMPALAAREELPMPMDLVTELRKLLDLSDDADAEAIVAAVAKLRDERSSAAVDPTQFVPIGVLEQATAALARVNRGVTLSAATAKADAAISAGKLPPFLKSWAVDLACVNAPALDQFIERTSAGMARLFGQIVPGQSPGADNGLTDEQAAIARQLGLTAEQFAAAAKEART